MMQDILMKDEPRLMPFQSSQFNGDMNIDIEFLKLKDKFKIKHAIELGSCVGGTTRWLSENFDTVDSIEINFEFLKIAKQRCTGNKNISFHLGDTVNLLQDILTPCKDNVIVFIDSHWHAHFPLFDELKIIQKSKLKPVIVIHDCKVPNIQELGYDSYGGIDISFENVKSNLDGIYGIEQYNYYFNSKVSGASRGVIFIHPHII